MTCSNGFCAIGQGRSGCNFGTDCISHLCDAGGVCACYPNGTTHVAGFWECCSSGVANIISYPEDYLECAATEDPTLGASCSPKGTLNGAYICDPDAGVWLITATGSDYEEPTEFFGQCATWPVVLTGAGTGCYSYTDCKLNEECGAGYACSIYPDAGADLYGICLGLTGTQCDGENGNCLYGVCNPSTYDCE